MILTAGQQEQGHGLMEPVLYGPLVQMAEPLKWAVEVTRLEDLPRIVRRAAKSRPRRRPGRCSFRCPATSSIPRPASSSAAHPRRYARAAVRRIAAGADPRILKAQRPVIIAGDEIVKSDALVEAAQLAETLGAPAYQCSTPYGAHFLSESPCFLGALSRLQKQVREVLSPYDLMIVLGADPLRMSVHSEVDPLPDGLSDHSGRSGRLGSRQELFRGDCAKGRRERDSSCAGARAEVGRRRGAGDARQKRHCRACGEELVGETQGRGRADFRSREQVPHRSRLARAAARRVDAGQCHPGR